MLADLYSFPEIPDLTGYACEGHDTEIWTGSGARHAAQHEATAKEICGACPVRQACLDHAMATERGMRPLDRYGIYGGLNATERAQAAEDAAGGVNESCQRGHAWTVENTYLIKATGRRRCRKCVSDRNRELYAAARKGKPRVCKRGHAWTEANTRIDIRSGLRTCRACERLRGIERRAKAAK